MLIPVYEASLLPFFYFPKSLHSQVGKKVFFPEILEKKYSGYAAILENKKRGKRSFINWNEHRETKNERIGTKTVLRVKKSIFLARGFSKAFSVNNKRPITVHEIMARYIRNCLNKKYRNYVGYTFRMMERKKRLQRLQKIYCSQCEWIFKSGWSAHRIA